MKINISKDIDNFNKNNFWKGLGKRELFHAVLCIIVGITVVMKAETVMGTDAASYIAMLVVTPIGLNGFYKKNGMYFGEYIREHRRQNSERSKLTYGSYDRDMLAYEITVGQTGKETERNEEKE